MKNLRFFMCFCFLLAFMSSSYASDYLPKDEDLIHQLKSKNIRLFVMRNGEAINNIDDLTISWRSPQFHLTKSGKETVLAHAYNLSNEYIEAIYTSPMYRALNTAEIIGEILNLPYYKTFVEEDLRQQNFGIFEGSNYHEYKSYFPSSDALYMMGAPEGETGKSVYTRIRQLLWKIATSSEKQVVIITHAFNIAYINRLLEGDFGDFPKLGEYKIYDFSSSCKNSPFFY